MRREIVYCIEKELPIIPLLLEGGRFPSQHLPPAMAGLARYQHSSQDITTENIEDQIIKVVEAIHRLGIRTRSATLPPAEAPETTSALDSLYPLPEIY